jgi:hypothetical protein
MIEVVDSTPSLMVFSFLHCSYQPCAMLILCLLAYYHVIKASYSIKEQQNFVQLQEVDHPKLYK